MCICILYRSPWIYTYGKTESVYNVRCIFSTPSTGYTAVARANFWSRQRGTRLSL